MFRFSVMLVALASILVYLLFHLIIMPLSCLKLCILIYGLHPLLALVASNITSFFLTIFLISYGYTRFVRNLMSIANFSTFGPMLRLNSNEKSNLFSVTMVVNLIITNFTPSLTRTAYNFVSHVPAHLNRMVGQNA